MNNSPKFSTSQKSRVWMEEVLNSKIDIDLRIIDVFALAYSVMEYLKPLIENQTKLFFEQASGCLRSYYFCKRSLEKITDKYESRTINEYKIHNDLFAFFKHHMSNDGDILKWKELNPVKPIPCSGLQHTE